MLRLYQIFGIFCVAIVFRYIWEQCKGLKYRKMLIPILAAQVFFVAIGYFYLSIPLLTYLFIGGVGIPAMISGMMFDPNILLIVAATYLPYNLLLPGLFGGIGRGFNLTNIVLFSLLVSIFFSKKPNSRPVYSASKIAIAFIWAFVILTLLSYVKGALYHGPQYLFSFIIPIKRFLDPIIVFLLFYKMISGRGIIKLIFAILMLTVVMNFFFGLLQWVHLGLGTYSDFYRRLTGFSGHPNFYSAFIAYYFGFIAGPFLIHFREKTGKFLLFPMLLGLRIIIPTNSRGGWLAMASALPVLSFFRSKLTMLLFFFGVCLVLIFPDHLVPNTVRMRIDIAGQPGITEAHIYTVPSPHTVLSESKAISMRTRWILLEAGWALAQENIWFGLGWGLFPFRIGDYDARLHRASAHNFWLQLLVEMGLITLIVFFVLLALIFKSSIYVFRRERDPMLKGMALGLIAAIPAIIVANLTGNRLDGEELMFHFWITAACILQLRNILRTERFQEESRVK